MPHSGARSLSKAPRRRRRKDRSLRRPRASIEAATRDVYGGSLAAASGGGDGALAAASEEVPLTICRCRIGMLHPCRSLSNGTRSRRREARTPEVSSAISAGVPQPAEVRARFWEMAVTGEDGDNFWKVSMPYLVANKCPGFLGQMGREAARACYRYIVFPNNLMT